MGYINPLLELPAGKKLLQLPAEQRAVIEPVLRELRVQANREAELAWKRKKGPMAAYWRAVATYARHMAHALSKSSQAPAQPDPDPSDQSSPGLPLGGVAMKITVGAARTGKDDL